MSDVNMHLLSAHRGEVTVATFLVGQADFRWWLRPTRAANVQNTIAASSRSDGRDFKHKRRPGIPVTETENGNLWSSSSALAS